MKEELKSLTGEAIVVDTASSWVYLGTIDRVTDHTLILISADAHDIGDTDASKEKYIYDSRTGGIRANRDRIHIRLDYIVGFSLLEDVKSF